MRQEEREGKREREGRRGEGREREKMHARVYIRYTRVDVGSLASVADSFLQRAMCVPIGTANRDPHALASSATDCSRRKVN